MREFNDSDSNTAPLITINASTAKELGGIILPGSAYGPRNREPTHA